MLANSLAIPNEAFLYILGILGMLWCFKGYDVARDYASKYIISLGKQCSYMGLYVAVITLDAIVVFGANRMTNITLRVFSLL